MCEACKVLSVFSLLLFGQQGLGHFFRHWPLLPISRRILQTVSQWQGKLTNSKQINFHR